MIHSFLPVTDELSGLINNKANSLFEKLKGLDVDQLNLPYYCQEYFKSSHSTRLYFSIETSARLLYQACRTCAKQPSDIRLMDYGAGVGTLYLLAGMSGFQQVIYNDHLDDWKLSAEKIADAIGVHIDNYIVGDIGQTLSTVNELGINLNLVVSRNVLEHIYKPHEFFLAIRQHSKDCLVFSSTTANAENPGAVWKHHRWHAKWEKQFLDQRTQIIRKQVNGITEGDALQLAQRTRGLAMEDLNKEIQAFACSKQFPVLKVIGTNTCDPSNGVWFENLLPFSEWRRLISSAGFEPSFEPGFWDTHYSKSWKNLASTILNKMANVSRSMALRTAPFIYIIAKPQARQ